MLFPSACLDFRKENKGVYVSLVYNEEQQQLDDSAREFLMARSPVSEQRRLRDQKVAEGFDVQIWQQMLEFGWGGIALPEAYGGLEFGFQGFAPIFEQIGRNLVASPLLTSVVLCGSLIVEVGDEKQRAELLPTLIEGQQRLAFASQGQDRFRPEHLDVAVTEDDAGFVLEGHDLWVPDANLVDSMLVAGRLPSGDTGLFLVPVDTQGVQIEPLSLLDSRNHAKVSLNKVQLPASARIGSGNAQPQLELALDRAAACVAAELLGAAAVMFEMTIEYLKTRTQFGILIGSFQALQHRAAWMLVDLELARSAVMAAFEVLNDDNCSVEMRQQLVSLAKWKVGEVAHKISREAVQMHGGIGVTDEYDLGFYLKRSRVAQVLFGDSDYHCERYGQVAQRLSAETR